MLKIKFKKLFALFLALVLVTMQVFVAFAHEADAESTNQNVNPQANEEVLDGAHDHEHDHDEIFESANVNNEEEETETEFVGEELDDEETEETKELEEPENPNDLANDETEITNETETETETVSDETENETEAQIETDDGETEAIEEEINEQVEVEAESEINEEEIEVEIVDGEIVELNKNEELSETASETEEEYLEEIAETVPVKNAQAGEIPGISWIVKPHMCEEEYQIDFQTFGYAITSIKFNDEEQDLPADPTQDFSLIIHPDYAGPIVITAENENGVQEETFPQRVAHTATYLNSLLPPTAHGLRTISAVCAECGANLGTAEFTTSEGVDKPWTAGGVKPFAEPTYSADWEADPLVHR